MFKRLELDVEYFEDAKRIVLHKDLIDDEEHNIWGDVYINHDDKEIRIYNFNASLTDNQKIELMYALIETSTLFPFSTFSKENMIGDITQYILLINGYLLDGSFREPRNHYKCLIEEFIEAKKVEDEVEEISYIRNKVAHFYNKYKNELGNEEVTIYTVNNKLLKGIIDYINFSRVFSAYLWSKGKRFRVITNWKFWEKEQKFAVLPY